MQAGTFLALAGRALERDPWPVLTLHAELEGGAFLWVVERLLADCAARGVPCLPLVQLLKRVRATDADRIPEAEVVEGRIRGRAGRVAVPAGLEPVDEQGC